MATLKQNMLEYSNVILKDKGTSNTANLKKAFPSAPQYNEYKDAAALKAYEELLNNERSKDSNDAISYYGLAEFNFNYSENGAPNLQDVETGGAGKPATPFSPNPSSPGPGDHNAASQPEFDGDVKNIDSISNFGTGLGGLVSPSETATNIAITTIGKYISGRSFQGSDGNS